MPQTIENVEIFATGTWNGMKFTLEDLQEIVDNTEKLLSKGTNKPPLKIGHSSNQIMKGQSDGDPALGWIDNLKVVGNKLVASFKQVPDILFQAFSQGLWSKVSVEMRNLQETGWFLTAVAVLGADLPAVKTLDDIEAFLSENKPDITGDFGNAYCFKTIEPIFSGDEMENETQSQELEDLKAKLKEAQEQNAQFKSQELDHKFSDAKAKVLEQFEQDVKDGKLTPALRDKIDASLVSQRAQFSEGTDLSINAELVKEIAAAYASQALVQGEQAESVQYSDNSSRIDEKIEVEIAKVQATTGKDYFASRDLVFKTNPSLNEEYKSFTLDISEGRL